FRWGLGFMLTCAELPLGPNPHVFGHGGWGGSLGFADLDARGSWAYVMNRMSPGATGGSRAAGVIGALYGGAGGGGGRASGARAGSRAPRTAARRFRSSARGSRGAGAPGPARDRTRRRPGPSRARRTLASNGRQAAVDDEFVAGDVRRFVGEEEG